MDVAAACVEWGGEEVVLHFGSGGEGGERRVGSGWVCGRLRRVAHGDCNRQVVVVAASEEVE